MDNSLSRLGIHVGVPVFCGGIVVVVVVVVVVVRHHYHHRAREKAFVK